MIINGMLCLTPETFNRLDSIARHYAGCPVEVRTQSDMGNSFASFGADGVGSSLYQANGYLQIGGHPINVVNKIDLAEFKKCPSPELDWGKIPNNLIYDFLIWHEVVHAPVKHDYWAMNGGYDEWESLSTRTRWLVRLELERRADAEAWYRILPGRKLPKTKKTIVPLKELRALAKAYKRILDNVRITPHPIPAGDSMIPRNHQMYGIPWAIEVFRHRNNLPMPRFEVWRQYYSLVGERRVDYPSSTFRIHAIEDECVEEGYGPEMALVAARYQPEIEVPTWMTARPVETTALPCH